ncbi:MAG: hypothetical protein ACRDD7_14515 [Peptostreptococcaceae bacterium]
MNSLMVNISERNDSGKNLRRSGFIPCIIYGQGLENTISGKITVRDSINILACEENTTLSLNINDEVKSCVLKCLERDAMGNLLHIDFLAINQ